MNLISGTLTDGLWEAVLPAGYINPSETLTYYFEATNKRGKSSTSDEFKFTYFVKKTEILFYYNDCSYIFIQAYYWNQAQYEYDKWIGEIDGPAPAALVDQYDYIVRVDRYSPLNIDSSAFKNWLASGTVENPKHIFWSSQEFLVEETRWRDTTYQENDWHNVYLGIAGVVHDLQYVSTGAYDQAWPINAVLDDPISGALAKFCADSGFQLQHDMPYEFGDNEWSDGLYAGTGAKVCFTDAASGMAMGIYKETETTKSVFLAFDQLALNMNPPSQNPNYVWPEYGKPVTGLSIIVPVLEWLKIPTKINLVKIEPPIEYQLEQNYPNPFNQQTKITYSLAKPGRVKLVVLNLLGQVVGEIINEYQPAGTYSVNWNINNLTSGLYFYSMTSGNYSKTMKMMVLR